MSERIGMLKPKSHRVVFSCCRICPSWRWGTRLTALSILVFGLGLSEKVLAQDQPVHLNQERRLTPTSENLCFGVPVRVLAEISGVEKMFIFDSGATGHILDKELRKYLSPPLGYVEVETANGEVLMTVHDGPSIKVDSETISLGEVAVTDFSSLTRHFGFSIAGFLGSTLVIDFGVGYDQAGDFFYMGRDAEREFDRTFTLEITESKELFTHDVWLDGAKCRCLIDTGMNTPLSITSSLFDELTSRDLLHELSLIEAVTVNGNVDARFGLLTSLEVWGHRFENVPVAESTSNKIGLELLTRFGFCLNGPSKIIEIVNPSHPITPFLYDRSGLSLEVINEKLMIVRVEPDSPGERANLTKGIQLLAVNGGVQSNWREQFRLRELLSKPGPVTLTLRIEDNSEIREVQIMW